MKKSIYSQKKLPSLPIPLLDETKKKLLEWVEPLVSAEQFGQTKIVIEKFFSEEGEAPLLQQRLLEWDRQVHGSWLKPFWDEMYLAFRGSLPLEMNFNMLLNTENYRTRYTLPSLIGKISYLVAELYHSIVEEKVEPEMMKGTPLCMSQYPNVFKSVRIPRRGIDEYKVGEWSTKENHVVFMHRNNFYRVAVTDANGNRYSPKQLEYEVELILATEPEQGENIGIFTAAQRDIAADVYDELSTSIQNAANLQTIADALAVISIDEECTGDALESLFSTSSNRYYDKTLEIIVLKNGEVGFNFEHTGIDGTTSLVVINHISDGLQSEECIASDMIHPPTASKMEWVISEEMKSVLHRLKLQFDKARAGYDLNLLQFTQFGASEIKKLGISPDAFFHMALQIAQYRTFGAIRSTYEPVAVRFFTEGRTECARAASNEKSNLVMALEKGDQDIADLYQLMKQASQAHSVRLKECQQGQGVERHLYGLQKMYEMDGLHLGMNELPALFKDTGYTNLRYDFLSTSGMTIPNVKSWIFGPVVEDGYGIGYSILDDQISINLSSKMGSRENGETFLRQIVLALNELWRIGAEQLQKH